MSDARRRAEEALAKYRGCAAERNCVTCTPRLADALRALLASEPAAPGVREPVSAAYKLPAPVRDLLEDVAEQGCKCPAFSLAPGYACECCRARAILAAPAPPAADEVREAAERVEAALPAVRRYQRVPLPLSSDHAAMAPGTCECRWHATDGLLWSVDSLLAALAARGGAG